MIKVSAPAVIKFFGEHAVVYGKKSVAVAISIYSTTIAERSYSQNLSINLKNFNLNINCSKNELYDIYKSYKNNNLNDFIIKNKKIDFKILPCVTISAIIQSRYKTDLSGIHLSLKSDIPIGKGLASSASLSASFTGALLKILKIKMDDTEFIELVRTGDKIIHRNENAGRIDVPTTYYGQCVSFSKESGYTKEDYSLSINILLINTGSKKSTAEMVMYVANMYNSNKQKIELILDNIHQCAINGLSALKSGDINELGKQMYLNQAYLIQLGVSTDKLNRAVDISKSYGAYGAKLSGGGGGGLAFALTKKNKKLETELIKEGFDVINTTISKFGCFKYL